MPTDSPAIGKRRLGYYGDATRSFTALGVQPTVRGRQMARGQQPRPGEQLLAQGAGPVVALVHAALLQDGHDQVDKVFETLRGYDAAEVEAVDIGFLDPGDQVVGNLLGRADDGRVAAAQPHPADDPPQRPRLGTQRRQGLDRRVYRVVLDVTDRLVRRVSREVEASGAREMRWRPLDAGVLV